MKGGRKYEGWIRPRGTNGTLYAFFRHKGVRYCESSNSTRMEDARNLLDRMKKEIKAGTYVSPTKKKAVEDARDTVAALAKKWLGTHVATSRSAQEQQTAEYRIGRYLLAFMGKTKAADVRPGDIRAYRLWLEALEIDGRHLKPQTVKNILADARCFFTWAADPEEGGYLDRNPFPRPKPGKKSIMPKVPKGPPKGFTHEEEAILSALEGPHGFACRIMLGTGIRWSELLLLKATDLDGDVLTVRAPKTGDFRRVTVPAALVREIKAFARFRPADKLVPWEDSRGDNPTFSRTVSRRSGVKGFGTHRCRHTFAYRWLSDNGNLGALQLAMGHSSIETTMIYAKADEALSHAESRRLNVQRSRVAND